MRKSCHTSPCGTKIVAALTEFLNVLKCNGKIAEHFVVRTVTLDIDDGRGDDTSTTAGVEQ